MALNILLSQSFTHIVGSEAEAKQVVEDYKKDYSIKKSTIDKKTKKSQSYWVAKVEAVHVSEKEAFEMYFDVE